jgi:hypothetical protein
MERPAGRRGQGTRATTYRLWVHDATFSKEELVIDTETFPMVKEGSVIDL